MQFQGEFTDPSMMLGDNLALRNEKPRLSLKSKNLSGSIESSDANGTPERDPSVNVGTLFNIYHY